MDFIIKLQNKPEHIRKRILWATVIIIGLILIIFWITVSYQKIQGFQKQEFIEGVNLPALREQIQDFQN